MKQVAVASKALTLIFGAALLAACSGTGTQEDEAAAAAAAERAAEEEAARAAEAERMAAAEAEVNRLKAAVDAAGNVVYFAFDSSNLSAEAQATLDAHIALAKETDASIRLEGHTDERGTRDYNMALGERRANSVRDYMVVNGVPSYRIETVSYGEEDPVAYGSNEAAWSQNRRVEIKSQ